MLNNRTLNRVQARPRAVGQWLAMCLAICALLPVVGDAQAPAAVTLKAGLRYYGPGNLAVLTVTEVGPSDSTGGTSVTIEFFDAKDQRRGFKAATTLQRGKPVQLRVQIPRTAGFEQLRPVVVMKPGTNFLTSRPIVVLEELEVDTLRVVTKDGGCAVRMVDHDTSPGSGAEQDCEGWDEHQTTM